MRDPRHQVRLPAAPTWTVELSVWNVPALGSSVPQAQKESLRQSLLGGQAFPYAIFQPVERVQIVSVAGASADVTDTSVSLNTFIDVPSSLAGVQYEISIQSTGGVSTIFVLRHKPLGANALTVESQVAGVANFNNGTVGANSGQVTYAATKNAATSFTYAIYVTGFWRSY